MAQNQSQPAATNPRLGGVSIAVVGAGRIGAELIRNLGRLGFGRIDVYEADAHAADRLRGDHAVHEGDFWDELTLARLRGYDFAICTVQDPAARVRMNQKCLVANVSLLQAWTEDSHAMVAAFPFGLPGDCACYECDAHRAATPMPLASLKLSVAEAGPDTTAASRLAAETVAGALGAALTARIATGAHGSVARRASLDTTSGEGASVELQRDPDCRRCRGIERPVPIVHTRNRWAVSACVAASCPEVLDQSVQLSDELEDMPGHSFRVGELVERFRGGPIPAKFALTELEGRVVCLDFEDVRNDEPQAQRPHATPLRRSS